MNSLAAHPTGPASRSALRHNRAFILLWTGQAISNIGDLVFDTTLILWIATVLGHGHTWAPLALSGVVFAAMLPMLFVGPLAGIFIDRWDKRRTMLAADGIRAMLILLLVLVAVLAAPAGAGQATAFHLGAIYAIVFLASACAQFFNPARLVLIGDIVSEPARAQAAALGQMTQALAIMVGPAIAAVPFFTGGVGWALGLNAASFAVSCAAILAVRPPQSPAPPGTLRRGSVLREFGEGRRFYAGNPTLRTILAAVVIAMAGGGALSSLNIFFITKNLHVSPHLYGLAGTVVGVGTLAGAVLASAAAGRIGLARVLWLSMILTGLLVIVYARLSSFAPAIAVLFLLSMPNVAINVVISPMMLQVTPRHLLGRVASVINPTISLANMIAVALAGFLASAVLPGFHATLLGVRFGPIDTIFTSAGVLVVLGGLYAAHGLPRTASTVVEAAHGRAEQPAPTRLAVPRQQAG